MNKRNNTGWQKVFIFTLKQNLKSKTIKITTLILLLVAIIAAPAIVMLNKGDDSAKTSDAETIYVSDKTNSLMGSVSKVFGEDNYFSKTKFVATDEPDKIVEQLKESKSDKNDVLMEIEYVQGAYTLTFTYGDASSMGMFGTEDLAGYVTDNFKKVIVDTFGLTADGIAKLNIPVTTSTTYLSEKTNAETVTSGEYGLSLGILTVSIMLLAFAGSAIASSVVTEKSSKVVELLMTSIKPMAIVIGKVLAVTSVILIQFGIVMAAFLGSSVITENVKAGEFVGIRMPKQIADMLSKAFPNVDGFWYKIILILIILALGFVFYGVIAALAGATISKMDELSEGIKLFTGVMIISAYVCIAILMGANIGGGIPESIVDVVLIFPLTSLFLMPAFLLLGKASVLMAVISIAVLIVCIMLLFRFVSNVYEYLIYQKGSRISFKQILSISKQNRKPNKKEAK